MNAVIGLSHLALKTDLTPRQRDYVLRSRAPASTCSASSTTFSISRRSRPANLSIENIDFDLDKVLENVGNLMSEKASAKGLELIFEVEPTVSTHFRGDPLRLGQILINFCNNAVKFTEKGEVAVQVRVLEDTADSQLVEFSVSDTGIGMTRGADRAPVPGLRAGRRLDHPQIWRHRAWPRHLQAADRADGRPGLGRERARQGQHVPLHRAARQGHGDRRGRASCNPICAAGAC